MLSQPPILITGSHRSGSTFVGKLLSVPAEVGYVEEAYNIRYGVNGVDRWNPYITNGSSNVGVYQKITEDILRFRAEYRRRDNKKYSEILDQYQKATSFASQSQKERMERRIIKMLNQKGTARFYADTSEQGPNLQAEEYRRAARDSAVKRLLLKDVSACLMSEWLLRNYQFQVIILVRHPAAVYSSMKRLHWNYDLSVFTTQKSLMHDFFEQDPIPDPAGLNNLEQSAFIWKVIYTVAAAYARRNPGIMVVKHEDICVDPVESFQRMYRALNLEFTQQVKLELNRMTAKENPVIPPNNEFQYRLRNSELLPQHWKQTLNSEEIGKIREITESSASLWYTKKDWEI